MIELIGATNSMVFRKFGGLLARDILFAKHALNFVRTYANSFAKIQVAKQVGVVSAPQSPPMHTRAHSLVHPHPHTHSSSEALYRKRCSLCGLIGPIHAGLSTRVSTQVKCFIHVQSMKNNRLLSCQLLLRRTDDLQQVLTGLLHFLTVSHDPNPETRGYGTSPSPSCSIIVRRQHILSKLLGVRILMLLLCTVLRYPGIRDKLNRPDFAEERRVMQLAWRLLTLMSIDNETVCMQFTSADFAFMQVCARARVRVRACVHAGTRIRE